jgi:hypothetical protein
VSQLLVTHAAEGFTVLSPATGQATIWVATAEEAQHWAEGLTHHPEPAPDRHEQHQPAIT